MKHFIWLLLAGLVITAPAAAGVTVRAESGGGTVVTQVSVPRTGAAVTKDGATCTGDSAAGALDRATAGDWDGTDFGGDFGVSVDRIRSIALPFDSGRYWNFDHNNVSSSQGVCGYKPGDGDELLFYAACYTATTNCFTGTPLDLLAPATATAGVPFSVTVRQYDDTKSPAPVSPAEGATVAGGDANVTTAADGTAQVTVAQPGTVTLIAFKGKQVRDETTVAVKAAPVYTVPTAEPTATAPPTTDTAAPVSRIRGIREGRVFKRGPRTLRATISDASALASVKLSLTRRVGRRCTAFSGRRERFVKARCGAHPRFEIGTSKTVSFLLPKRLGKGRYVLDVLATDVAGNREALARGTSRVVFRVR